MLNFLAARENGSHDYQAIRRAECTRRAFSLELSKHFDVEKIHSAGINSLDVDPVEYRYLLSSAADGVIGIHDLYNTCGEPRCTYQSISKIGRAHHSRHKFSVETIQWYPHDTGMFVSSGMDSLLKVWDTNELVTADEFKFDGAVYAHDISQIATQHCLIAVAGQSAQVRLIDLKSGSATHTLKGHRQAVLCARWSNAEEFLLATGSEDSRVLMWDIRSAKGSLRILDQHNGDTTAGPYSANTAHNGMVNGMCFTSDGLHLLTIGTDERLRLWKTASGENTNVNYGKIMNGNRKCIKLSVSYNSTPDLVYVPEDSNIVMYKLLSGEKVDILRGHYNQVNCCLFNPLYQELLSAGNDRNILVWTPETASVEAFEAYLKGSCGTQQPVFVHNSGATADTWSSDEDG